MHPQLSLAIAEARQQEFLDRASRHRRARFGRAKPAPAPATFFEGLTLRLATTADRQALARLAELDPAQRPAEPVLLGVVKQRPVVALSLSDGRVIADPFFHTAELTELLRVRARQLARRS
jgi:hypothetical protein